MSKPDRDRRGTIDDKLARLLDSSQLARVVPHLPAETLHQLVRYRGVECAGELMASATPEQVTAVMDLDLWRGATAGADQVLDVARFGEWIEALVESDAAIAARIVAGLDRRLVVAAISGYLRVFDIGARTPIRWNGEFVLEEDAGPSSGYIAEIGGYVLHARRTDAWDAILALLLELEANHPGCFHEVMAGSRRLSNSAPERDGLDHLLPDAGQLLHDAGLEREGRRQAQGYLTPAAARAFLRAAREPVVPGGVSSSLQVIAAEHTRPREPEGPAGAELAQAHPLDQDTGEPLPESIAAIGEILAEAGLLPGRPRALLAAPAGQPSSVSAMQALMAHAASVDDTAFQARGRELTFLANALMAGCSLDARAFTIQEASDAVVATCNLGLELHHRGVAPPPTFLVDHDLVTVFQVGWQMLHELALWVADRLVAALDGLRISDLETQLGLHALRQTLARQRASGTPWKARDALDVIATLDVTTWASLLGITDECPVVPDALAATLERRKGPVNAKGFAFISTTSQVRQVHAFMDALAEILVR